MAYLDRLFKTKREKYLFYITITVVIGAIFLINLVFPAVNQWMTISGELNKKRNELSRTSHLIQNKDIIEHEFDKYQKGIRLTDPEKRPEDTLLLQADEIQRETNVSFTRMDPVLRRNIPRMPGYQSYTLQVAFEADLINVGNFLQAIQERGLYIDYLSITPKTRAAHNPTLQNTVRIGKIISRNGEE